MPGPSFTWSLFANNANDAIQAINSDRICTIVVERLHESLVVAAHYLGWSLADMVVTLHRKAQSTHPKHSAWPPEAVKVIKSRLMEKDFGEYAVYSASVVKLNERISTLAKGGVDVAKEVDILKQLQARVSKICLDEKHLKHYRKYMSDEKLPPHASKNKLRDVPEKYETGGHLFSFNREIVGSFDVCGPCEAHAMLLSVEKGLATSIEDAKSLFELDPELTKGNVNFAKCPIQL
mmetsp:Transcript_4482/g.7325  ORF Transcript_4482/g.7325 Transcript_4482/m.7325 type:complete len:235 (-) Transcript_4482:3196-3900(-)